jgi:hypothetical protein
MNDVLKEEPIAGAIKCCRFVVIGTADDKFTATVGRSNFGDQGQGDTGKDGMDINDSGKPGQTLAGTGGPFKKGVALWQGEPPAFDVGAIEFPSYACAVAWLSSVAGTNFSTRYQDVYILATQACSH